MWSPFRYLGRVGSLQPTPAPSFHKLRGWPSRPAAVRTVTWTTSPLILIVCPIVQVTLAGLKEALAWASSTRGQTQPCVGHAQAFPDTSINKGFSTF